MASARSVSSLLATASTAAFGDVEEARRSAAA
jgi:hypothetical protein